MYASAIELAPAAAGRPHAPDAGAAFARQSSLDLETLRGHVNVRRCRHASGQHLYRAGQAFQALYLVHAGSYKSCELADDGREQVCGFRMRGELVGAESIGLPAYACDAVALEDSEAWELPYPAMLKACLQLPELQAQLARALAAEIRGDRSWMLALGTLAAERRVAAFLLDVAARYARLGFSARHFILRMSRLDMASFLALKHETVSRALSHLHGLGCVEVRRREVRVLDMPALRALAGAGSA